MAGSLIKVDEFTVTSAVANVIIGGGSSGSSGLNYAMDSTYDVYLLQQINIQPVNNNINHSLRFTVGGTADTSANYDYAQKIFRSDTTWNTNATSNQTSSILDIAISNSTSGGVHSMQYIFNASNSSEFTFYTNESSRLVAGPDDLRGMQGGGVFTSTSAVDGIQLFFSSGNISAGKFVLYGLKK
jgi:hypothetical protein